MEMLSPSRTTLEAVPRYHEGLASFNQVEFKPASLGITVVTEHCMEIFPRRDPASGTQTYHHQDLKDFRQVVSELLPKRLDRRRQFESDRDEMILYANRKSEDVLEPV